MAAAGLADDLDGCERAFSRILSDLNIAWEALRDASKGIDDGQVAARMAEDRKEDALLFYFWHARNVDVHQVIERRISAGSFYLSVVDRQKADRAGAGATNHEDWSQRLYAAALGVSTFEQAMALVASGNNPSDDQLESVGLAWMKETATLSLLQFRYQNHKGELIDVGCPDSHFGTGVPNAADRGSELAIDYYAMRLAELQRFEGL
jgi:hypothetical protein